MTPIYYFGAWSNLRLGHYLYLPGGAAAGYDAEKSLPFRESILDSGLLIQEGSQTECVVHRSVINGWTILCFWDRSGDSRSGSNSAFVIGDECTTETGMKLAREKFPEVFARLKFPLLCFATSKEV